MSEVLGPEPSTGGIVAAGLRQLRVGWRVAVVAAMTFGLIQYFEDAIPKNLGLDVQSLPHGSAYWARELIAAAAGALAAGVALRLWLGEPGRRGRRLGGVAAFVGLSTAGDLLYDAVEEVPVRLLRPLQGDGMTGIAASTGEFALDLVLMLPIFLLMLWPMSLAAGDTGVDPPRAARLMGRSVFAYGLACLVVTLPVIVLSVGAAMWLQSLLSSDLIEAVGTNLAIGVVEAFCLAAAAAVYRAKARPQEVAAVFD